MRPTAVSPALCAPSCSLRPAAEALRTAKASSSHHARQADAVRVRANKRDPSDPLEKVSQAASKVQDLFNDDNILEYCSLDAKGGRPLSKMSLGEKEAEFLNALTSFYYDSKPIMSNEEFDNLKEELIWEGSTVAVLSPAEQRFMEASLAYNAKKPIMSDDDYDKLKGTMREQNSKVASQGPRCSLRTRSMYSDANADYLKMTLLNVPAALLTLLALFSVDDITGFRITQVLELPQPWGILVTWGCVLPLIFLVASSLTQLVFRDGLILNGKCPNCGTGTQTYFGDIFIVKGPRETNTITCDSCKSKLEFNAPKRWIQIKNPGEGDPKGGSKGGGKAEAQPKGKAEAKKPASKPSERKQPEAQPA